MLAHGDKVKDYEIIAPIRSGGMAMLYLARRRGLGGFSRLVALKLVHAHLTDDPNINRLFLQEARIAGSVAHPNVVHVEEVGTVDGKYFIAMEYVHGVSLDQLLTSLRKQRRCMSSKLCIWIAAQISEALHAVHEATLENGVPLNIVHRDVSPQNVLIGHTGHIKLIDFGIAKSQLMSYQASRGGSVLGKLRYMAPEQLQLLPVSRRTDVYALGVMLWEMLAARNLLRCFRIDDERDWATRENPPPPSKYTANLSAAVDQAVLKAIACAPDARYENALAFRRALLRAEPSASLVDAPAFATLIRHLLGDELARRRADWPSEVNVQLESDVVKDTGPTLDLDELTARFSASEAADPPAEADFSDDETVVRHPSPSHSVAPRVLARSPEAHIVTVGAPASRARPLPALAHKAKELALRNGVVNTAIVALFVAVSAYVMASLPRVWLQLVGGRAAAGYVTRGVAHPEGSVLRSRARGRASTRALARDASASAEAPLQLRETEIVSSPRADTIKQTPARLSPFAAADRKRARQLAPKRLVRTKSKAVLSQQGARPGRR